MYRTEWSKATTGWLSWLTAGGTPTTTLTTRTYQLRRLAADLGDTHPWAVTDRQITDWLGGQGWALETLRSHRTAVRGFYGWAHAHGLIDTDPTRLLRKIPHAKARPRPASEHTIAMATARADDRQALMLQLGAGHGLRRGEIARVHTDDLVDDLAGSSLIVHGKGAKDRVIPLLETTAAAIRACPAGWVFPNGYGGHLTPGHVGVVLRSVMTGATPHQLRHRFATRAYQATHDLRAVQELLGHANPATTQTYTAVPDESLRAVILAAAA